MGSSAFLGELAAVALVSGLLAVALTRLRMPVTAGLLVAGALIGPSGLGLVRSDASMRQLAEAGVVFLLFTIGLEFSVERVRRMAAHVFRGGALQVGLTIVVITAVASALGVPTAQAVVFGLLVALSSSTALVLRLLSERGEVDAPHGRIIVGSLIFQDLCVVPAVLAVPLLYGPVSGTLAGIARALALSAVTIAVVLFIARRGVPTVLGWVDLTRSREAFVLVLVGICLGTAWLTSSIGLSLALGAFLSGIAVAGTDYRHRALGDILPIRDSLTSLFFVSFGMFFDAHALAKDPLRALLFLGAFTFVKAVIATLSALVLRFPARIAWLAGLGLAQFGEFGFVLAAVAERAGVVAQTDVNLMLSTGVLSMIATPLVMRLAPRWNGGERVFKPLERLFGARTIAEPALDETARSGHVVLVGLGVAGQVLARALIDRQIPFVALELNAETVRRQRQQGWPVYYADASSTDALEHAHLARARIAVLMINDPEAVRRAIVAMQRVAPGVPILARARYLAEVDDLRGLGAASVVAEEVEGASAILKRVLDSFEQGALAP